MKSVIVVGPDHQNTLGVIRAVGKEGYTVDLIIYGDSKQKCKCKESNYLNGRFIKCSENEDELVKSILQLVGKNTDIPVIPTSDFAAMCIDKNHAILEKNCVLPSISGKGGAICKYMDKYEQKKLADQFKLKMAKTLRIDLANANIEDISDIPLPCVLKPVVSAVGLKSDIRFANNRNEFINSVKKYKDKGYSEVLVQEFIKKDYEVCIFGCLTRNSREFFCGALKKIRYSPSGDGASLSYAQFIDVDENYKKIISVLKTLCYDGLFDIEIFVVGNELYLNEINFRNSGNAWAVVNRGINIPIIWIKDALNEKYNQTLHYIGDNSYFMNETADLKNVLKRNISLFQWIHDLFKTKTFNKFWRKDIKGSLAWYRR